MRRRLMDLLRRVRGEMIPRKRINNGALLEVKQSLTTYSPSSTPPPRFTPALILLYIVFPSHHTLHTTVVALPPSLPKPPVLVVLCM